MPRTSRQLLTGLPVPPHPHPVVFFKPCTSFSWAPEKTQTGGPLVTARAHFPVTPRALCSCHQRGMCPSCSYFMSPPASAGLLACCPPPRQDRQKVCPVPFPAPFLLLSSGLPHQPHWESPILPSQGPQYCTLPSASWWPRPLGHGSTRQECVFSRQPSTQGSCTQAP